MARIIALIIVLAGAAGGVGLGLALAPLEVQRAGGPQGRSGVAPGERAMHTGETGGGAAAQTAGSPAGSAAQASGEPAGRVALADRAYVKLGRQVVIPIVEKRRTEALMLFELALEVPAGMTERAYAAEPRLRDAFLQSLLEMSYTGAFSETYTDERITRELRDKLRGDAQRLLEGTVFDVLILDMLRQEL